MRWPWQKEEMTAPMVELARHQVEQQQELDVLNGWIEKLKQDVLELERDVLARTARIQALEIAECKLPRMEEALARQVRQLATVHTRLDGAETSLDNLERGRHGKE